MPNTAPVQVPITVDNATASGIQSAVASLKQFEAAGSVAGERTSLAFKEARGSAELLGETIGVRLNRELRGVLASSSLLGPLLESAFPIAAAVGFASVLFDLGKKIYDFANGTEEAAKQAKELTDQLKGMAEVRGKILAQATDARAEGALIGLTGSGKDQEEINQLNSLLIENESRIRNVRDQIFGLKNAIKDVDPGFADVATEVKSLNGTLGELEAREELLQQQLSNKTSQQFVDQRKEEADAAEKEAQRLKKLSDALDQISKGLSKFGATSFSGSSIDRVFGGARGSSSVGAPSTGSLSSFGINSPLFPLFATKQELEIAKQYGFVLTGITEKTKQLSSAQKTLDDAITKGFDNAFQDIALGTRSIGQAFESLAASVAASVLQMVAKLLILPPIISAINSLLGAIGLGSNFGKVTSDIPLFGGIGGQFKPIPRAGGGPTLPNNLYLVGENGPELLSTGSTSGSVSPMSRGSNIQVNVINQTSQPATAQASTKFDGEKYVTTVVLKDLSSGGPIRRALAGGR